MTLSRHPGAAIRILDRDEMRDIPDVLDVMIGMAARLAAKRIGEAGNRACFAETFDALQAFRGQEASFELEAAASLT